MFYSTDLLKKRTSLGVAWAAAHGRRLQRNRILSLNICDVCDKIIEPEVPHSLRLQALLASGIVILHDRQVNYLKEDTEAVMVEAPEGIDLPVPNQKRCRRITIQEKKNDTKDTSLVDVPFSAVETFQIDDMENEIFVMPPLYFEEEEEEGLCMMYPKDQDIYQGINTLTGAVSPGVMDAPDHAVHYYDQIEIHEKLEWNTPKREVEHYCEPKTPREKIIVKPNARKRKPTIDLQSLDLESIFNGSDQRNQESVLQHQEQADQISISKKKLQVCMMDAPPACGILQSEELASLWRDISRLQRNSKRKRQEIAQDAHQLTTEVPPVQVEYPVETLWPGSAEGQFADDQGQPQGETPLGIERLRSALQKSPNQGFGFLDHSSASLKDSRSDQALSESLSSVASDRSFSNKRARLSELAEAARMEMMDIGRGLDIPSLLETDPSQGNLNRLSDSWNSQTLEILSDLNLMMLSSDSTFDVVTSHLSRLDAARMFHHVLVGVTRGYVRAMQHIAYGPIHLDFTF